MPKSEETEFLDASEIEFVRRGRKSNIDPDLVNLLARLPKGKAVALNSLRQDPTHPDYAGIKSRISAQVRSACKSAGLTDHSIRWSPSGVPQVVR